MWSGEGRGGNEMGGRGERVREREEKEPERGRQKGSVS